MLWLSHLASELIEDAPEDRLEGAAGAAGGGGVEDDHRPRALMVQLAQGILARMPIRKQVDLTSGACPLGSRGLICLRLLSLHQRTVDSIIIGQPRQCSG